MPSKETDEKRSSGIILPLIMTVVIIANIFFMLVQSAKINKLEQELNYTKQVINNQGALIERFFTFQIPTETEKNEQGDDKKEDSEQMPEKSQSNNTDEVSKETENEGGNE